MHTYIQKWGNSLGIRIPKAVAKKLHLCSGTEIELRVGDDNLVIERSLSKLDELLGGITADNTHAEISCGKQVGNEAW